MDSNEKTDVSLSENNLKIPAKPFLKWAGGKRKLLGKFKEIYPEDLKSKKIKNYFEPFLGSGAVFLDVVQSYDIENTFLCDINEELIMTYKVVQRDVLKLIECLEKYEKSYLKLNKEERSIYFYGLRWKFNTRRAYIDFENYSEKWVTRAAQYIFLNRTCYNGLYRVNSKGEFNCAVGEYKNPTICDAENLLRVSKILSKADIRKASFDIIEEHVVDGSFIYFDPPYRPLKSSSFMAYNPFKFDDTDQIRLSKIFNRLHERGSRLMLSNSDPKSIDPRDDFFDRLYSGFNIRRIPAPRFINSNAEGRGCVNEIVVTNY